LLGSTCTVSDYLVLPSSTNSSVGPTIDVSIDVGSAQTYVTGYTCVSNTSKTLTTHNDTSLLNLKIGQISSALAFPSSTTVGSVVPKPLAVLDIGTKTCKTILGIGSCTTRVPFAGGGVGVSVDTSLGQASSTVSTNVFSYPNLNEIGSAPSYLSMVAAVKPSNLLNNTVSGLQVQVYKPASGNALGNLIVVSASILSDITNALNTAIAPTLTRLLTSVVDPLFTALGITLAPADVGANLSCNFGQATLVI
jgi:hypothetical protein